jgi:hypothetical protein
VGNHFHVILAVFYSIRDGKVAGLGIGIDQTCITVPFMAPHVVNVPVTVALTFDCHFRLESGIWTAVLQGVSVSVSGFGFPETKANMQAALEEYVRLVLEKRPKHER